MSKLVSGMMLEEKTYGDLHTLITCPYGWLVIDANGSYIKFEKENYTRAYIPQSYEYPWTPSEGTEIIF